VRLVYLRLSHGGTETLSACVKGPLRISTQWNGRLSDGTTSWLPGVFTPVQRDGRVLIDGGGVNPVPHDLLDGCDITIAIDVMGEMQPDKPGQIPNLVRAVLGTFDIMQNSIVAAKRKLTPPDICIRPTIVGVDILEFYKAEEVYAQAAPERDRLVDELKRLLDGHARE
jgi:NTE family protein